VIVLLVSWHHEPWRDEADSWLLARDASLRQIIDVMPYAGTPPLWYLLLFPFAKLGFPYVTQAALNAVVMIAAAGLLLFRAPFSLAVKSCFAFSYYLAYEYSVIARSYGLSVLLIFCLATIWSERLSRPLTTGLLILALANTNTHSLLLAGLLFLLFLWDVFTGRLLTRAATVLGVAIAVLGLCLAFLEVRTPPDASALLLDRPADFGQPAKAIGEAFFPGFVTWPFLWLALLLLSLVVLDLWPEWPPLLLLFSYVSLLLYLFVFVWVGGPRHYGFLLLTVVLVLWIRSPLRREADSSEARRLTRAVLTLLVLTCGLFSFSTAVKSWFREVVLPFSGAEEMARFISNNRLESRITAAHFAPHTESILPYLQNKKFWYAGLEDFGSFMKWDRDYEAGLNVSYPDAIRRVERRFPPGSEYLLLLGAELPQPEQKGYRLLFSTSAEVFGYGVERFFLYEPSTAAISLP